MSIPLCVKPPPIDSPSCRVRSSESDARAVGQQSHLNGLLRKASGRRGLRPMDRRHFRRLSIASLLRPEIFVAVGVCHKVNAVAFVRPCDTASWQYGRSHGVAFGLQVMSDFVEPSVGNRSRNLLSKHDWRTALADEPEPYGPEMARVGCAAPSPRSAEWLAGAAPRPDGPAVVPPREPEGLRPSADPGEEIALSIVPDFIGFHLPYVPFIHIAGRYQAGGD